MVTIRDVARDVGLSITTVSVVLNGKADSRRIAHATRKRVERSARRLGYRHNALAKSLREGKSNLVGIVGHGYPVMHHTLRVEAAARALIAEGFQVSLQNLTWQREGVSLVKQLLSQRAEGLLIEGIGETRETLKLLRDLARQGFPMASLRAVDHLPIDQVTVNRESGVYLATRHLLSLGHRRIGFVLDDREHGMPVLEERLRGYRLAHEELGVRVDETLLLPCGFHSESSVYRAGYLAMQHVLKLKPRPTAMIMRDDQFAIGAMRAAFEAGLRVPEDIAIVGFVGFPEGEYCPVPLTTVAFPFEAIAREAVRMLKERISGKVNDAKPRVVTLGPQLIVRCSCGAELKGSGDEQQGGELIAKRNR